VKAETISEQLFFTTVWIEASNPGSTTVGTGFVYAAETDAGTVHVLVTNKHVVEEATSIRVRMIEQRDGQPLLGHGTEMAVEGFGESGWVGHPDPAVDVAVLPFGQILTAMQENGAPAFFRSLSHENMASETFVEELDAIEEVTFIGYPNGLFDTVNYLPIARRGSTATPVGVDYQGKPAFLIDASVFPGSSGSPVFLMNRGMYQKRDGGTVVGGRFACLGIVSAVHVRQVDGTLRELPTALGVRIDEPIDLGIVYKARTIDEAVDTFLEGAGVARIDAPPSAPPGEITDADQAIANDGG